MPPVFVFARLTVQEASRRRLLLALLVLTLLVVGFSAWGFHKITTVTRADGTLLPPTQVTLISSQLLIVVTFMYIGVLALSAAVVAWLMAWIAGVVGDIGTGLQNSALQNVGTISHLLLPTDGLWRGAVYAMEPDVILATLRAAGTAGRANPFSAVDPPPNAFLA